MAELNNDILNNEMFGEENEKPIDWKAMIMEYLIHWPYILVFLVLSLAGAYVYNRFQVPTYAVNATVLIKQGDKQGGTGSIGSLSTMQEFGVISMAGNFDNEMEIIRSRTLIKKVVNTLGLNINYSEEQPFAYDRTLYKTSPVNVWMTPDEAERLPGGMSLDIEALPGGMFNVKAAYFHGGEQKEETKSFDKLPALMITPVGTVSFSAPQDSSLMVTGKARNIKVYIGSPTATAAVCKYKLSASPLSRTTTIMSLNYTDTNVARGLDFINTLVALYNRDANDDKNEVASRTAEFINKRIEIINKELSTTESEIAEYKQKAGLTDISSDANLAVQGSSEYNSRRAENTNQLRLIGFLREYIDNPENKYEVIPSNVGLSDQGLASVLAQYNEMLIERKRLLRTSNEKNPAVVNLNTSIEATRGIVAMAVETAEKSLVITRNNLDIEAGKFEARINKAPIMEKELIGISRQQAIKADLYLMLLQKREENAITLAATANNGRIIEEPLFAGQTGPKSSQSYMIAFVFGLAFPIGCIFLIRMLRFKIEGRADVERITSLTIVGDVPAVAPEIISQGAIVVHENKNDLMEEVFRSVRTNIHYMLGHDKKVILITSTGPGEGKSFIAGNLASSFAFMGKKTLIMGMDIRKPGLNKVFNIPRKQEGITNYLASPETVDVMSLCQKSDVSDNLYIIPGGIVPPNPTELVARDALDKAMETLRKHFDYIILDTAPIGIVTDTQLISRVADMSIYVCRADHTNKSDFQLVNELKAGNKLPGLCTLINGIDMDKRRNGYYYGYGKYGKYGKYGYGKKYGYGYGYGYGDGK